MNLELKNKWLAALRSGEYEQARGRLLQHWPDESDYGGYCCLGVLAHINGAPNDDLKHWATLSGLGQVSLLTTDPNQAHRLETELSAMNDGVDQYEGERKTFAEIANWIEANVEAV